MFSRIYIVSERMIAVVRWFISTLYASYGVRSETGNVKKPYNPILGEQFFCDIEGPDNSVITMLGEQGRVSQVAYIPESQFIVHAH